MEEQSKSNASSQFFNSEGGKTKSNAIEIPSITLPKGGGALKGIDEKFQVNPVNGTSSFSIPLAFSPNRNGFTPQLSLSYNSGIGNGLFGIGWDLDLPAIQRQTEKILPRYFDSNEIENIQTEDSIMFSGVEELVPYLDQKAGKWVVRQVMFGDYTIRQYRPRIEGSFSRVERIHHQDRGFYWRITSKENITTFFGYSKSCRIADPRDESKIFHWLPEFSFDDKGSWVWYEYKAEDLLNVKNEVQEKNRFNGNAPFINRFLKRIRYGNQTAYYIDESNPYRAQLPFNARCFFDVVFDYGEHDQANPAPTDNSSWLVRKDPYSSNRASFEMRTYRLCQRVLMYHTFPELNNGQPTLVRSIDFNYTPSSKELTETNRPTELTYLTDITLKGYVRRNNSYASKALPKMVFDYQWLQWHAEVKDVTAENLVHAPVGLSGNFQWVDLFSEGINGILTEQGNNWFYKSNLGGDDNGDVRFSSAQPVIPKPSFTGLSNGVLQLQDLEANGEKQVVVNSPGLQGYFELTDEGEWEPFKAFLKTLNLDLRDPNVRMFDVNGDGRPEVVLSDAGAFWWWGNAGKIGYDSPQLAQKPYDEEKGPAIVFSDQEQRIYLADMTGDGLTDIVRISNCEVSYWANFGYGRFSAKVTMGNAPVFDQPELFNPAYLQLADISGTGSTDIIYLGKNKFKAYLNFSGNVWSDATEIEPFFPTEQPNKITVTDLLGNGTACIVWSSELPAYRSSPMRYIDLMGGKKPHIMRFHENGFGKKTEVEYKSSTWFYLQDKLKGEPWVTKLAFPVQCVSKTIVSEAVTTVRFTAEYSYHHGHYDHAEREFRGFGRVEQKDTEYFDVFVKTGASNTVPAEHHQPPVLTKTWFHTGAFLDKQSILTQFKKEYWQEAFKEKGFTANAVEFELPDAILLGADNLLGFDTRELSADEWREAFRACKGMMLRQEVFGLDAEKRTADEKQAKGYADHDPALLVFQAAAHQTEQVPYSVAFHNCEIQLLQKRDINRYAVFMVKESESITYAYERNPEDPRIAHTLTTETDELGNVLEVVSVVYPRLKEEDILKDAPTDSFAVRKAKEAARKGQQKQWITYTKNEVTNDVVEPESYYLRKGWETKTYELSGITPTKLIFTISDFKGKVKNFQEIKYQQKATTGAQKRLIEHIKTKFYNADVSAPLPDGKLAIYAIPFEAYQLAYTPDLLADIFTPTPFAAPMSVTDADMQEGKFLQDNNKWWIQSGTVHYRRAGENFSDVKSHFFAPVAYTDPFDSVTEVVYDPFHVFMQKSLDAQGNQSQVLRFNFRTLSADIMRDINDNISSVIVDELGLVKAAAVEGKATNNALQGEEGDHLTGFTEQTEGVDAQNIINFFNPASVPSPQVCNSTLLQQTARKLLGNASARMLYDFSQQPTVVASIAREQHAKQNPNNSPLQISFEYSDGLGKVAMKKVQAEAGVIPLPDGTTVDSGNQLRWVGNGRTVLNNKGKPIRQYEPYFSTTPAYENDPDWVKQGVSPTIYYDGAGRNVKTELPNGTFTKVAFDAWKQYSYDVNDTAKDSAWYKQRLPLANNDREKIAAQKTEIHFNTPSCLVTDTLGRQTLGIEHNRWEDTPGNVKEEYYYTHTELDIEGNSLSVTDARGNVVMSWQYDMLGHRVAQMSMDAGKGWMLNNALGNPVKTWDERQHEFSYEYDVLHRPIGSFVKGADQANPNQIIQFEKVMYGDTPGNGLSNTFGNDQTRKLNLRGQPYKHYDTAGLVINLGINPATGAEEAFDFKGNPLRSRRKLIENYKQTPDWSQNPALEAVIFSSSTRYDALNRPIQLVAPHSDQAGTKFNVIRPGYNEANLLERMDVWLEQNAEPTALLDPTTANLKAFTNIDYDAKGQRIRIEYNEENHPVITEYTYDPTTFRLVRLLSTRPKHPEADKRTLQDLSYTYDPVGNITEIRDRAQQTVFFDNSLIEPSNTYGYDALYRLMQAEGREHAVQNNVQRDAKTFEPIAGIPFPNSPEALQRYTEAYKYDSVGNILEFRHTGGQVERWVRKYQYALNSNQLFATRLPGEATNLPDYVDVPGYGAKYNYDDHGNMISMPHLKLMEWDFKNQLQITQQQVVNNSVGEKTYYVYDAGGQRVRKVTETQNGKPKDERIYLGGFEVYRKYNGNEQTVVLERQTLHIMDDKQRVAMIETRTRLQGNDPSPRQLMRFQLGNHLGSAALELDVQAQVISYEEYHPYGSTAYHAARSQTETPKRYRYTGKERDEETGFSYHGARYYAPWLGRWTSADPIGVKAGHNVFSYVRCNPICLIDLKGTNDTSLAQEKDTRLSASTLLSVGWGLFQMTDLYKQLVRPGEVLVDMTGKGVEKLDDKLKGINKPDEAYTTPEQSREQLDAIIFFGLLTFPGIPKFKVPPGGSRTLFGGGELAFAGATSGGGKLALAEAVTTTGIPSESGVLASAATKTPSSPGSSASKNSTSESPSPKGKWVDTFRSNNEGMKVQSKISGQPLKVLSDYAVMIKEYLIDGKEYDVFIEGTNGKKPVLGVFGEVKGDYGRWFKNGDPLNPDVIEKLKELRSQARDLVHTAKKYNYEAKYYVKDDQKEVWKNILKDKEFDSIKYETWSR